MPKTIIKERPVGTAFEWHGQQIKVVEDDLLLCHPHCCFYERCVGHYCNVKIKFKGCTMCSKESRTDKKNIHYEKVNQ